MLGDFPVSHVTDETRGAILPKKTVWQVKWPGETFAHHFRDEHNRNALDSWAICLLAHNGIAWNAPANAGAAAEDLQGWVSWLKGTCWTKFFRKDDAVI